MLVEIWIDRGYRVAHLDVPALPAEWPSSTYEMPAADYRYLRRFMLEAEPEQLVFLGRKGRQQRYRVKSGRFDDFIEFVRGLERYNAG